MDFISSFIKRPISLVRGDSLPSSPEPSETAARLEHIVIPEQQNQIVATTLNDSLVTVSIMDPFNLCDEFRPICTSSPKPLSRATQTSDTSSNGRTSVAVGTNTKSDFTSVGVGTSCNKDRATGISCNNTIEAMLIRINDNLNMGDLYVDQIKNSPFPLSKPSSLNAICSRASNVKGPSSPLKKEISSSLSSLKTVAMAPVADTATSAPNLNKFHINNEIRKEDLFVKTPPKDVKTDVADSKIVGLAESSLPESPTKNLNRAKLTFEEGLIPTLKADINQHATPFLKVVNETDTATSSDNEVFVECQPYLDGTININVEADYLGFDQFAEATEMEAYFSAANSRNVTLTNIDPLNTTTDLGRQPENLGNKKTNLLVTSVTTDKIQEGDHHVEFANDSFGVEPMDIDISISEYKEQTDYDALSSDNIKIIGKEETFVPKQHEPDTATLSLAQVDALENIQSEENHNQALGSKENLQYYERVKINGMPVLKANNIPKQHEPDTATLSLTQVDTVENIQSEENHNQALGSKETLQYYERVKINGMPVHQANNIQEHLDICTAITAPAESIEHSQNDNISPNTSNSSMLESDEETKVEQQSTSNKTTVSEETIETSKNTNISTSTTDWSILEANKETNSEQDQKATNHFATTLEYAKPGEDQKSNKYLVYFEPDIIINGSSKQLVLRDPDSENSILSEGHIERSQHTEAFTKADNTSKSSEFDRETIDLHQSTKSSTEEHIENVSANTGNISTPETDKTVQPLTPNKPLPELNSLNMTVEMNTSTSSSKSAASSPNFPIKRIPSPNKQFPRTPTKIVEKEMPFLEKSEYTERIEIERKKSTTLPPDLPKSPAAAEALNTTIEILLEEAMNDQDEPITIPNIDEEIINKQPANKANRYTFGISTDENLQANLADALEQELRVEEEQFEKNNTEEYNKEKRRTFVMSPTTEKFEINDDSEKRRTFNVQTPLTDEESIEAMDIDVSLRGTVDDRTTVLNNIPTSPPIPTLQNRTRIEPLLSTSPPIPTLQNLPTIGRANNTSPPIPTLQRNRQTLDEFSIATTPPVPVLQNHQFNSDTFKVPKVPPQRTPPTSNPIMRQPIHTKSTGAYKNAENAEVLSAKEQTKSVVCDEKDIFAGNGTPSPMEEISSYAFSGFGSASNVDVGEQEFANADFQKLPSLIFSPSDFDYLLSKGNNSAPIDRSSLLLKFDPLLGIPVPVNQAQQTQEQQVNHTNATTLSPTIEEEEHVSVSPSSNVIHKSFIVDNKLRTVELNVATDSAKSREIAAAKNTSEANSQIRKAEPQNQGTISKKYASMSVDVIKDMNVENDCKKSFENLNSQTDENQMDDLEKKIKNEVLKTEDIEKKLKEAEQREEALIKRITDKDKTITKMTGVIEAYEKAIAELIAGKEQIVQDYEKQLADVKADRDSNYQHLTSLETTFSDLHVKYEKSKEMTIQLKSNEEALLSEKRQILENLRLQEQRYDKMKNHAMQQLEIANKKLETINKEHNIETTKLKALLKKEEISRASINEQLQQKARENAELVKICDELISGQGS